MDASPLEAVRNASAQPLQAMASGVAVVASSPVMLRDAYADSAGGASSEASAAMRIAVESSLRGGAGLSPAFPQIFLLLGVSFMIVSGFMLKSGPAWFLAGCAPRPMKTTARVITIPGLPRGCLVLTYTAIGVFTAYWVRSVLSVAIIRLSAELSLGTDAQARALSAFFYGYVLSNAAYTPMSQILRPCCLILLAVAGSAAMTLLLPCFVAIGGYQGLVMCRILTGCLQGVLYPSMYALLAAEFANDEKAKIRTVAILGGVPSLGMATSLFVSPILIEHFGWELAVRASALLAIPWSVLWVFSPMMLDDARVLKDADPLAIKEPRPDSVGLMMSILRAPPFYGVMSGHFAHSWMSYVVMAWLPTYLHLELGASGGSLALSCMPLDAMTSGATGVWWSLPSWTQRRAAQLSLL
eukprot:TRINITY_DN4933_c0_g1_i5.p1 TRINITY_DN4933_c0_g1~~TRINITY_DN4933_c0_g1_i5.p1  ORF type:complete len:412 (-),score=29.53 TRINITY_DN4933_c0_g1_i5:571-1806(-)